MESEELFPLLMVVPILDICLDDLWLTITPSLDGKKSVVNRKSIIIINLSPPEYGMVRSLRRFSRSLCMFQISTSKPFLNHYTNKSTPGNGQCPRIHQVP
jgi:hypothetical protein